MIRLVTIAIALALIWSIYWAAGSTGMTRAVEAWIEDRRTAGWVAEAAGLDTQGFPGQFTTRLRDVTLADPATGLAWDAPHFELRALSYQPWLISAIWPKTQRLATPLARYQITSTDMQANLAVQPGNNLALDKMDFTSADLQILPEGARQPARATKLTLNAMRLADRPSDYQIRLTADGFAPALEWRSRIDPGGSLPETLDALRADMTIRFDAPWDLDAIEMARPQPNRLDLHLAEARWGRLELLLAGALDFDTSGRPTGTLTIKARNWREILRLSVDSGALPARLSGPIEDGLSLVAQLAGNPQTLDIPLSLRRDRVFLGPVPIGPAPILRLR